MRSTSTFGLVHSTGVSRNSVNGARLNCTAISCQRRAQPLAGTQIERHAGPAPVVDVEPHRDERLGARVRRDVRLRSGSPSYCPRTTSRRDIVGASAAGTACSTFTFSSRTSSARNEIGGSIATSVSSWNMWFCTMSRSAPALS